MKMEIVENAVENAPQAGVPSLDLGCVVEERRTEAVVGIMKFMNYSAEMPSCALVLFPRLRLLPKTKKELYCRL